MMWVLTRLLINAAALWVATRVVAGLSFDGDWRLLFVVALVFGVLNVLVRPVLKLLTFPILIITLGLFIFVVNAVMLWLTSAISDALGLGFHVEGFRAAFLGALVVTMVRRFASTIRPNLRRRIIGRSWTPGSAPTRPATTIATAGEPSFACLSARCTPRWSCCPRSCRRWRS
jgi:putative membrane protein